MGKGDGKNKPNQTQKNNNKELTLHKSQFQGWETEEKGTCKDGAICSADQLSVTFTFH